jgi:Secretion system C-terminal sorting domain
MIWNNTGKSISQVQIDFANGQGFQTVTVGIAINISYADTGFKKWTIKVTLSDNSILQCYNEYNVLKIGNISTRFQSSQSTIPFWGIINSVSGTRNAATVWINYSRNNFTGTLRKPLIVVEGYDVSTIAPGLQDNYRSRDFIDGLDEANLASWNFNTQLDDIAGYDLVFVDFADGAADIVLNAGAVQEVINRVNADKVNDNRFGNIRQQNVVMGLSMGGLCARYALANMTKNFTATPTETRLLITHDSPHKGANVPLGLQYMIRMFGGVELFGTNVTDIYPDYNDAIGLLDALATQQLLLYRATTTNTFANNTFLDAIYRPMITFGTTGPQPTYRFIATANGNECANPLFSPGKTFINLGAGVSGGIYARFLFFKVPILSYKLGAGVEAYALPAAGSTNKIARVYAENSLKLFGFINIFKQLYNNTAYAPGTHLAVDGVPGSNYPLLNVDALNQLTTLPIFKANLYVSFPLGPFLGGYFGVYAYNAGVSYNFTFVSVASALDAGPYSTPVFSQKYVNGTNQNYPSTSETFIAQETVQNNPSVSNNVHIRFTARNSRWLFNEMENQPNLENCSSECSNPFYISGPDVICNAGTFIIPGLQRGVSISWTTYPYGLVNTSGTGNVITLTRNGTFNGILTLTANIGAGCSAAQSISKQITVGTVITGTYGLNTGSAAGSPLKDVNPIIYRPANQSLLIAVNASGGNVTSFTWARAANSYPYNGGQAGSTLYISSQGTPTPPPVNSRQDAIYNITAQSACGTVTKQYTWPVLITANTFRVAANPNPVTNSLNIVFTEPTSKATAEEDLKPLRSIKSAGKTICTLFDFNTGTQVKQWVQNETKGNNYNYNVAGVAKGFYVLQVDRDNSTATLKIKVE